MGIPSDRIRVGGLLQQQAAGHPPVCPSRRQRPVTFHTAHTLTVSRFPGLACVTQANLNLAGGGFLVDTTRFTLLLTGRVTTNVGFGAARLNERLRVILLASTQLPGPPPAATRAEFCYLSGRALRPAFRCGWLHAPRRRPPPQPGDCNRRPRAGVDHLHRSNAFRSPGAAQQQDPTPKRADVFSSFAPGCRRSVVGHSGHGNNEKKGGGAHY